MLLAYDLYGTHAPDLEAAKEGVEKALGCTFELHESDYIGVYYRVQLGVEESVTIRSNRDPEDGSPAEADFPSEQIMISIDDTARSDELRRCLLSSGQFYMLRHEEF